MRIGITLNDEKGLLSEVSQHFGQCKYFLLADIENGKLVNEKVVPNTVVHGGGGCLTVDGLLQHDITHVIAGGMGSGAQQKFATNNVQIFGYSGIAKDGIDALLKNNLTGLGACNHSDCK
jgi:predicted Fe-Mo cluster-binding NifX family protein